MSGYLLTLYPKSEKYESCHLSIIIAPRRVIPCDHISVSYNNFEYNIILHKIENKKYPLK